jgi:hypothetical protein
MFGGRVICSPAIFCLKCDNRTSSDCINSTIVSGGGVFSNCIQKGVIETIGNGVCGGLPPSPTFVENEKNLASAIQNASSNSWTIISLQSSLIEITSN